MIRPPASSVTVTARTVRAGDIIMIGGQPRQVTGVERGRGTARCHLDTGELLVIAGRHRYAVTRRPDAAEASR